jgi:hypothetical protein
MQIIAMMVNHNFARKFGMTGQENPSGQTGPDKMDTTWT